MLLKRIELHGFKSFANKTTMPFGSGLTAVVGPNGSGKSNFVDAIRWVLGEQRIKSLRAGESTDVIFSGNEFRKALSMAAVTLVLDNSHDRFNMEGDELAICRRLYRDGTSEYMLNGKKVRLKDVRDVLSGTGLGVNEYSIIEQGKVDLLLQLSPYERRSLFDEAAGILRYKERRNESMRRLIKVEENLLRLGDIIKEIAGQQKNLHGQAARTRRFIAIQEVLDKARLDLFVVKHRALFSERQTLEANLLVCENSYALDMSNYGREVAQKERNATELDGLRERRNVISDEVVRLQGEAAKLENEVKWNNRRAEEHSVRIAGINAEISGITKRRSDIDSEISLCRDELVGLKKSRDARDESVSSIVTALRELEPRYYEVRSELRILEAKREESRKEQAQVQSLRAQLGARIEKLTEQRSWYEKELERSNAKLAAIDSNVEEIDRALKSLSDEIKALIEEENSVNAEFDKCDLENERLKGELQKTGADRSVVEKRLRQLQEIDTALSKKTAQSDIKRLSDFIEVLDGWEVAAETLLGEFVSAGLVAGDVFDSHGSWIFPSPEKIVRMAASSKDGVSASDVIRCTGQFQGALAEMCQNVVFVESLPDKCKIQPGISYIDKKGTFLTRYRFNRSSAAPSPEERTLLRRSEISRFKKEIGIFLDRQKELEEQLEVTTNLRNELLTKAAVISRDKRRLEVNQHIRNDKRSSLRHDQGAIRTVRIELTDKLNANSGDMEKAQADFERLKSEDYNESIEKDFEKRMNDMRSELGGISSEREKLQASVTEARIALATVTEKIAASNNSISRLLRENSELDSRIKSSIDEREGLKSEIVKSKTEVSKTESEIVRVSREIESRTVAISDQEGEIRAIEQKIKGIVEGIGNLEKELDKARDRREQLRISLNETEIRINSLEERCMEMMGIPIDVESETREVEYPDIVVLEELISDSEKKLKNIGSVNMEAVNLLETVEQRLNFLLDQSSDLENSRKSLLDVIDDINERCRTLFTETFEKTRTNFNEIFRKLFGGGRADLQLLDGDLLEAGIEIIVRPPDKDTQQLSLLSGGEKALTAIALLMAMFRANPSPFCVLDEVDAPLDDSNIQRYLMLLREFCDRSQFIIITHNKLTIEKTDDVFGITLDREKVSRTVSVKLEKIASLMGSEN